ncbi:hypothetical protein KDW_41450 [Dictyobacter vulcani]|uniref:Type IV secretion protein Rhs n=1 Tax=Dictyobacter vulcani TaxID=2607529 RepID=A0A5J4KQV4_9CHLR|nr:RHS repeat protein [Dictyobacter vulcani]GER89983.1 hypothetical protein KDW_41450 [Dictyobacter vulcani]
MAQGLPSFTQNTTLPFERTTTLDAYHHQAVSYTDAIGRQRYTQVFKGNGAPYTVLRTIRYDRDVVGNLYATLTYDATSTLKASQNATYDGVGRKVGMNDDDSGSGWVYNYDADGNLLSQKDPRGQSTYIGYDVLNRTLCKGTTSTAVNPCSSSAYNTFFYDSFDNNSNSNVTFPSNCASSKGSSTFYSTGQLVAETFSNGAGSGSRCQGFDERGQQIMSGLSVTADGQTTVQTVHMSYDNAGHLISLVYPDGETITSQYDYNGYFRSSYFGDASSTDPVDFLVSQSSYTNNSELSSLMIGGNGSKSSSPTPVFTLSFGYDKAQRATSINASKNGNVFWNQSWAYDNIGNISSLSTKFPKLNGSMQTDMQSFCYDGLNRLMWAGSSGTPVGGDHCGLAPSNTTIPTYQQNFAYDALDRFVQGPAGSVTYGNFPAHAPVKLGNIPQTYASYDSAGNMTCRNVDVDVSHSCDASQTGATMTYDNEEHLVTWTAPNGTQATDQFLYDGTGNRVLQRVSTTVGTTTKVVNTITFGNYTVVVLDGSTTSTTKYYQANSHTVALRKDGTLYYLVADFHSSISVALDSSGNTLAVQLFAPWEYSV